MSSTLVEQHKVEVRKKRDKTRTKLPELHCAGVPRQWSSDLLICFLFLLLLVLLILELVVVLLLLVVNPSVAGKKERIQI
jgi:quinol-cytochrome oxidoreductase complex cytochrome b subunit